MGMTISTAFIEILEKVDPNVREAFIALLKELEKSKNGQLNREDFSRLEKSIERLSISIEKLTQAQIETEKRLQRLEATVQELIEAQKGMEERLKRLEEAQIETEKRFKRLEEVVEGVLKEQKRMRQEIGGLAHTIGYRLEDEAIRALPALLKKDFDIRITRPLRRGWIDNIELNIYGEGKKGDKDYFIIGEAKTQLKKRDVDRFIKNCSILKDYYPKKEIFKVLITYQTSPAVEEYAKEKGIKVYYSFEL